MLRPSAAHWVPVRPFGRGDSMGIERAREGMMRADAGRDRMNGTRPDPAETSDPGLYMIGSAHLDPVWLWRWPEGCAEAIATCWAAVDLLDEQPGLIFTRGEAAVYRWVEALDPALFAHIQRLVREGRWSIVNGWWIQPDCNLPDGESFIRHALHGKRYFRQRFGVEVEVGYNVDSFGHAGTLPMILRHTGYHSYVFMRPQEHEKRLPSALFDWVA